MTSRARRLIRGGGQLTLRGVAKLLFIAILLVLTGIAVSASAPLALAALAMFIVYLMVRTVLPAETIEAFIESIWTGDVCINAWQRLTGVFPW